MHRSSPTQAVRRVRASLLLVGFCAILGACGPDGPAADLLPGATGSPALDSALDVRLASLEESGIADVYGSQPYWVAEDGLTDEGREAIARIRAANEEGLELERYLDGASIAVRSGEIAEDSSSPDVLARVDVAITRALDRLSRDLAAGRLARTSFDPGWHMDSVEVGGLPDHPTGADSILAAVDALRPELDQYGRLIEVLAALRGRVEDGGWEEVPGDRVLEVGDSATTVVSLRARLQQSLRPRERTLAARGADRPARFDSALARSVTLFQARNGLVRDGVLGSGTAEALNTPAAERVIDVEIALERWRWLPSELGSPAVLVNTAGRRVLVMEDGTPALSMKTIIGQRDWKTLLFQDELESIVVNPYWNIPETIFAAETLPKARQDPDYLRDNRLEVVEPATGEVVPAASIDWEDVEPDDFPYRVRQKPGPGNSLGRVKFLFPNRHAIYLHDTPHDQLFDERLRTFSHGCIRVEHPRQLARYFLRTLTDRPPGDFDRLRATGERHAIALDRHAPVYLIYQTVWVDDDGVPTFYPDVYRRNGDVRAAFLELTRAEAPTVAGTDR